MINALASFFALSDPNSGALANKSHSAGGTGGAAMAPLKITGVTGPAELPDATAIPDTAAAASTPAAGEIIPASLPAIPSTELIPEKDHKMMEDWKLYPVQKGLYEAGGPHAEFGNASGLFIPSMETIGVVLKRLINTAKTVKDTSKKAETGITEKYKRLRNDTPAIVFENGMIVINDLKFGDSFGMDDIKTTIEKDNPKYIKILSTMEAIEKEQLYFQTNALIFITKGTLKYCRWRKNLANGLEGVYEGEVTYIKKINEQMKKFFKFKNGHKLHELLKLNLKQNPRGYRDVKLGGWWMAAEKVLTLGPLAYSGVTKAYDYYMSDPVRAAQNVDAAVSFVSAHKEELKEVKDYIANSGPVKAGSMTFFNPQWYGAFFGGDSQRHLREDYNLERENKKLERDWAYENKKLERDWADRQRWINTLLTVLPEFTVQLKGTIDVVLPVLQMGGTLIATIYAYKSKTDSNAVSDGKLNLEKIAQHMNIPEAELAPYLQALQLNQLAKGMLSPQAAAEIVASEKAAAEKAAAEKAAAEKAAAEKAAAEQAAETQPDNYMATIAKIGAVGLVLAFLASKMEDKETKKPKSKGKQRRRRN